MSNLRIAVEMQLSNIGVLRRFVAQSSSIARSTTSCRAGIVAWSTPESEAGQRRGRGRLRACVLLALLAACATRLPAIDVSTSESARRGEEIVRRALSAHGWSVSTPGQFSLRYEGIEIDPDQDRRYGGPSEPQPFAVEASALPGGEQLTFEVSTEYPGGFRFRWRRLLLPDATLLVSSLVEQVTPLPAAARPTIRSRAEQYFLPLLFARLSEALPSARWLGEVRVADADADAVLVPLETAGQATLLFDRGSGRLLRYETVSADPLRGSWVSAFVYSEYRPSARGTPSSVILPGRIEHRRDDELLEDVKLVRAPSGEKPPPELWAAPSGYAVVEREAPRLETVAAGVHLVTNLGGGYYNALFVEQPSGVVAIDVPLDPETAEAALGMLAERAAGKPVTHAIFTHHHLDHSGGAAAFAARGAKLVTTPGNRALFEALAGRGGVAQPQIVEVRDAFTVGEGANGVVVQPLARSPHADEMLLVTLPGRDLVFDGDLYSELVPPNETTRFFLAELERLGLTRSSILGTHHSPTTAAAIRTALDQAAPTTPPVSETAPPSMDGLGAVEIDPFFAAAASPTTARWRMVVDVGDGERRIAGIWTDEIRIVDGADGRLLHRVQEEIMDVTPELFPAAAARGEREVRVRRLTEVDARTLAPRRAELQATTGWSRSAIFGGGRYRYEEARGRPPRTRRFEGEAPETAYDFHGGLYGLLLAALPLVAGAEYAVPVYVFEDEGGRVEPLSVRVVGRERLLVGDRPVAAWRVEVATGMTFWLVREPPYVVRLVDRASWPGKTWTFELMSEGEPVRPAGACASEEHRQLDFWVGDWEVRDLDGVLVGASRVDRLLGGCAIEERWRGTDGFDGVSVSSYDALSGQWHQVWTDDRSQRLEYVGTPGDGAVVFEGETSSGARLAKYRMSLAAGPDDTVRQRWEISRDGGSTWHREFDGVYTRKEGGDRPAANAQDGDGGPAEPAGRSDDEGNQTISREVRAHGDPRRLPRRPSRKPVAGRGGGAHDRQHE